MKKQETISLAIQNQFNQQVDFLRRLVQARSTNPFTPDTSLPSTPVEQEVANIICQELHRLGFKAELFGVSPQRPNVVCYLPGSDKTAKTLVLTTHMDTVEPSGYTRDPWSAQTEDGRLYGVGAANAKAQIAAFTYAAHALRQASIDLAGHLVLAFVVDEESGACSPYGTKYLLEQGRLPANAAIIGEPGNHIIAIGHRGLYRFRLTIYGEPTHTGIRAWEEHRKGRNAILDMAQLSVALSETPLPKSSSAAFPHRNSVFTFPTLIQGGSGINTVPGTCEAYGDVRLLPGTSEREIKQIIKTRLNELSITKYQLDDLLVIPPAETEPQSEIVQTHATAIENIIGTKPALEGAGPACDGWMFTTQDIPTVCGYGVICGGVHGADEWIELDSLRKTTEIYANTILNYLKESVLNINQ
jgi:acetylornithine deacetylase/succinyl-diaminopimelate desuccinylase-like protein